MTVISSFLILNQNRTEQNNSFISPRYTMIQHGDIHIQGYTALFLSLCVFEVYCMDIDQNSK